MSELTDQLRKITMAGELPPISKNRLAKWANMAATLEAEVGYRNAENRALKAEAARLRTKAKALLDYCQAFGPQNLNEAELAVLCKDLDAALHGEEVKDVHPV